MNIILTILIACFFWIQTSPVLAQSLPQDPEIQAFFNQNQSSEYIDPYRGTEKQGDNLEQIAIDAISNADSIDLAFFEFRLPLLAKELVKRHFIYHLTFIIYHSFGSRLETSPKLLSP